MRASNRFVLVAFIGFVASCLGTNPRIQTCGNGKVDPGETCDTASAAHACPTQCDDGDPCTVDTLTGTAETCSSVCAHRAITSFLFGFV